MRPTSAFLHDSTKAYWRFLEDLAITIFVVSELNEKVPIGGEWRSAVVKGAVHNNVVFSPCAVPSRHAACCKGDGSLLVHFWSKVLGHGRKLRVESGGTIYPVMNRGGAGS
jgi:hypothetical protein